MLDPSAEDYTPTAASKILNFDACPDVATSPADVKKVTFSSTVLSHEDFVLDAAGLEYGAQELP